MSIKLQKRGASWRLRYDLEPDASGVRQRRSATFKGTKRKRRRKPPSSSPPSPTA